MPGAADPPRPGRQDVQQCEQTPLPLALAIPVLVHTGWCTVRPSLGAMWTVCTYLARSVVRCTLRLRAVMKMTGSDVGSLAVGQSVGIWSRGGDWVPGALSIPAEGADAVRLRVLVGSVPSCMRHRVVTPDPGRQPHSWVRGISPDPISRVEG